MTTTSTHFTFRVDTWPPGGESIVEHVAGVGDYQVALATFRAACQRWPGAPITLRQGARVIEDSRASARGLTKAVRGSSRPWPMALPKASTLLYMSAQSRIGNNMAERTALRHRVVHSVSRGESESSHSLNGAHPSK